MDDDVGGGEVDDAVVDAVTEGRGYVAALTDRRHRIRVTEEVSCKF